MPAVGSRLGPYEILSLLGAGGMGEVYRARDSRLGREVAVKVLPEAFSADPERLMRFEKEARSASSLNHPSIVTIHDIGVSGGVSYIAMEKVEGQTLRELLAGGPLAEKFLLSIGAQVADGLAKAHEAGIVHRDLKPENVMVTADGGFVKILDFGLAKLTQPEQSGEVTSAATAGQDTAVGVVIGTAGYMSPEQATGKPLDFRSDLFSFGSILYEMVTGKRAFGRNSVVETLTAVIRDEPESIERLRPLSPVSLRWLVERCLAKNPQDRYAATRDLAHDLTTLKDRVAETRGGGLVPAAPSAQSSWRRRAEGLGLGLAAILAAATFALVRAHRPAATAPGAPIRFVVGAPQDARFAWVPMQNLFAVSPDGRRLAFAASGADGRSLLYVRSLAEVSAVALKGTEGAAAPFWAPDSRFLGFFAGGKLKKIEAAGGPPVTLCDVPVAFPSGSWGIRHSILFAGLTQPSVSLVADGGGAPATVLTADPSRRETSVCWPSFFPDGRHFLYVGRSEAEKQTYVRLASLDSRQSVALLANSSRAQYVPGDAAGSSRGYLLYAREGSLMAQPFDHERLRLSGDPVPAGEEILQHTLIGTGLFSASDNGVLASRGKGPLARLAWVDRTGRETGSISSPGGFESVEISPDSRSVLVGSVSPSTGTSELWVGDLSRGVLTRLDIGSDDYHPAVWSPDGARIAYSAGTMRHAPSLFEIALHASGSPRPILPPRGIQRVDDWSPDGRFLLYFEAPTEAGSGLSFVNVEGQPNSRQLLAVSDLTDPLAQFSPDGRWIAYGASEAGRSEVFLAAFPTPGERIRISVHGGSRPRWNRDGSALFFVSGPNEMTTVPVRLASRADIGEAQTLFPMSPGGWRDYDVARDGSRFLVVENLPSPDSNAITVTANWPSLLRR